MPKEFNTSKQVLQGGEKRENTQKVKSRLKALARGSLWGGSQPSSYYSKFAATKRNETKDWVLKKSGFRDSKGWKLLDSPF